MLRVSCTACHEQVLKAPVAQQKVKEEKVEAVTSGQWMTSITLTDQPITHQSIHHRFVDHRRRRDSVGGRLFFSIHTIFMIEQN